MSGALAEWLKEFSPLLMARTKRMTQPTDKSASISNAIIKSINEIRKIKRNVPGKESISTLASKRCGLSVTRHSDRTGQHG